MPLIIGGHTNATIRRFVGSSVNDGNSEVGWSMIPELIRFGGTMKEGIVVTVIARSTLLLGANASHARGSGSATLRDHEG
jgi:hypothetical protein